MFPYADTPRIGSLVIWGKSGRLAWILAWAIRLFDPDPWIRKNYKTWWHLWHTSQIVDQTDKDGWIVDEAAGSGDRRIPLKDLKGPYIVINWLPDNITAEKCQNFINEFQGFRYDALAYLWVALNRLSRGIFPRIADNRHMCWERTADFCNFMGHPICHVYEMAYMPLMIKRYAMRCGHD